MVEPVWGTISRENSRGCEPVKILNVDLKRTKQGVLFFLTKYQELVGESISGNPAIVIQLDEYDRSLGTDELNLAEFPLASLASRNETGQNSLLFEDTIFDAGANTQVERTVVIAGSDHFGLPTSTDSDILLLLVHLTNVRNGLKEKRVEFSRYELIKFLGWPQNGQSYRRLDEALKRWTSVTLHYKHAWWDRSKKNWKSKSFHVIETLELRGRDEIHDDGLSCFTWNDVIFESFRSGNLKRIDLGVYFNLRLAAARQMYRFLDKRFYKKKCLEFELRQFATEHIGLSRRYDNYEMKRKLIPALKELEEIGFITPCATTERFRRFAGGNWIIAVQKADGAVPQHDSKVVKELTGRGVNRKVARELASQFAEEQIEGKIRLHDALVNARDRRISRNPAGFLTSAIRYDYQEPPPEKLRRSVPRKLMAAAPTVSAQAALSAKPAADRFQKHWDTLSLEDQTRLEREALQQVSRLHRETLKRLEASDHALLPEMRRQIVREFWSKQHPAD
jgi:hypothetical protein